MKGILIIMLAAYAVLHSLNASAQNGPNDHLVILGDYKSSNGALKNDTTKDRTIVCMIPLSIEGDLIADKPNIVQALITFDNVTKDFDCNFQIRDPSSAGNNAIVASIVLTILDGTDGGLLGANIPNADVPSALFTYNVFAQCKIPGGSRVLNAGVYLGYEED